MKAVKIIVGILILLIVLVFGLYQMGVIGSCDTCAAEGGGCSQYTEKYSYEKITATNPLSDSKEGSTMIQKPTGTCKCGHSIKEHWHFSLSW